MTREQAIETIRKAWSVPHDQDVAEQFSLAARIVIALEALNLIRLDRIEQPQQSDLEAKR
jgi:hypothetical protein